MELQKAQEFLMVQHAVECRLAEDKIRSLESEAETLVSKKNESEKLVAEAAEKIKDLSEAARVAKNYMIQASLVAAESKLIEERKQFELMLEGKNLELSKPLKELSQRNDQAINDIQRKYEEEIVEVANIEKENVWRSTTFRWILLLSFNFIISPQNLQADNLVKEMERKWDEKISLQKEEAQQHLLRVKEEISEMIRPEDHKFISLTYEKEILFFRLR